MAETDATSGITSSIFLSVRGVIIVAMTVEFDFNCVPGGSVSGALLRIFWTTALVSLDESSGIAAWAAGAVFIDATRASAAALATQ
ncbi:MAG: hypothetical protein B5766_03475 [Candidatus Lumbricidophila eiseniae]|uniref:Uncharacterized protein n=1 Tax=Candidatus Lumbricidiphila eiseniae TaxID=1969409 RepID=A0A2A6FU32_9MICO|nr:MAG: hypothetical protein B5766_03475 [Candidatus Lumbricidophila eiseniae]